MTVATVENEIKDELLRAGLLPFLALEKSQFVDVYHEPFVELVLNDASKEPQVTELLNKVKDRAELEGGKFDFIVRSLWQIQEVGEATPAFSSAGGLLAATFVPVTLKSGAAQTKVDVLVTKNAEMELETISGSEPDLREVAKMHLEGLLKRGGLGYWDPIKFPFPEIHSGMASLLIRS